MKQPLSRGRDHCQTLNNCYCQVIGVLFWESCPCHLFHMLVSCNVFDALRVTTPAWGSEQWVTEVTRFYHSNAIIQAKESPKSIITCLRTMNLDTQFHWNLWSSRCFASYSSTGRMFGCTEYILVYVCMHVCLCLNVMYSIVCEFLL